MTVGAARVAERTGGRLIRRRLPEADIRVGVERAERPADAGAIGERGIEERDPLNPARADRQRGFNRIDAAQRERFERRRQAALRNLRAQPAGRSAIGVRARAMDALVAELLNELRDAALDRRPVLALCRRTREPRQRRNAGPGHRKKSPSRPVNHPITRSLNHQIHLLNNPT